MCGVFNSLKRNDVCMHMHISLCIITSKEMLMAEFFLRYTVCHSIDAETDSMIGNFTDSMKRVLM